MAGNVILGDAAAAGPAPWLVGGAILLGLGLAGMAVLRGRGGRLGRGGRRGPGGRPGPSGDDRARERHPERPSQSDGAVGLITFRAGPLRGNWFPISAGGLQIGRDATACQVVLNEVTVSRQHALIGPSGNGPEVVVRNLSGTNPTYVNDRAVQEAVLRSGDQIRIGSSVLEFDRP